MDSPTPARILARLRAQRSATAAELARHARVSAPALYRHLNRLLASGAIRKRGSPPSVHYSLRADSTLPPEDASHYAGRAWYHQRFDGAPLFIALIGEAEVRRERRKPDGTEARERLCFFTEGTADWYLDQADIDRGAAVLSALATASARAATELRAPWAKDEAAFDVYLATFPRRPLEGLSDDALAEEFETYHRLAIARFTSSALIDHFALGTDAALAERLRVEAGAEDNAAFHRIFSVATAPVHQSFINEAEADLLAIASRVQRGELMRSPAIQDALRAHQRAAFWTANNYIKAQVLPVDHFEREIESWLESGRDLAAYRANLLGTPKRNAAAKRALFQELALSRETRNLLRFSEEFTRWQDERKHATFLSIHAGNALLTEMGRRRGVDVEEAKFLLPTEVESWFLDGSVTLAELRARRIRCAVIWKEAGARVLLEADHDALRAAALDTEDDDSPSDIRGLVACTGKAIGTARIILSAEHISKVQPGDILVAVMTRPDYLPAMRKAAAIVTNEGGVTCHAAIVSRELGVPCIIGTKVATRVFKDGDRIEVNANHNWVRKVAS